MGRREVRQFEYTCDGYTRDGKKCGRNFTITAYDTTSADAAVAANPDRWTGFVWTHTPAGWLCASSLHRDDPRTKDRK